MTMAAAIESRTAAPAWSKASRIVSVYIVGDLAQAETIWRRLEEQQHFSTPYQHFDFLSPWEGIQRVLPGDEKAQDPKTAMPSKQGGS